MTGRQAASRPLLDARVAAFLVFSVGLAAAVFYGLAADNADFGRAKATVWPCAALGGWAVALLLRHGLDRAVAATAWRVWWSWGFLAYAVHLYWGFGLMFDWDVAAVYAGQGALVASANFALFFLWGASVLAAWAGVAATWLHGLAALLFAVSILAASILFGRDFSPVGGAILVAVWFGAWFWRQPEGE